MVTIDKILEKFNTKETRVIGCVLLIVVVLICWDVFSSGDNRSGADGVKRDIQSAEQHNQSAISELDRAKQSALELEKANARLKELSDQLSESQRRFEEASRELSESNSRIEELSKQIRSGIDRDSELIERGKRVVNQVRERDKLKN